MLIGTLPFIDNWAHIGGFLTGAVFGCALLENLEVTWAERYVLLPTVWVVAVGMTVWAVANYALYFPPWSIYGVEDDSCCVKLIECSGLAQGQRHSLEPIF